MSFYTRKTLGKVIYTCLQNSHAHPHTHTHTCTLSPVMCACQAPSYCNCSLWVAFGMAKGVIDGFLAKTTQHLPGAHSPPKSQINRHHKCSWWRLEQRRALDLLCTSHYPLVLNLMENKLYITGRSAISEWQLALGSRTSPLIYTSMPLYVWARPTDTKNKYPSPKYTAVSEKRSFTETQ